MAKSLRNARKNKTRKNHKNKKNRKNGGNTFGRIFRGKPTQVHPISEETENSTNSENIQKCKSYIQNYIKINKNLHNKEVTERAEQLFDDCKKEYNLNTFADKIEINEENEKRQQYEISMRKLPKTVLGRTLSETMRL
jgi:bifunctional N-acetylglucosamine-1-phosphate-uridyltransferase/glucosamine-1-phosphate-acetyltransferase GlmU-like protein